MSSNTATHMNGGCGQVPIVNLHFAICILQLPGICAWDLRLM
jgi:hypothetical protein